MGGTTDTEDYIVSDAPRWRLLIALYFGREIIFYGVADELTRSSQVQFTKKARTISRDRFRT